MFEEWNKMKLIHILAEARKLSFDIQRQKRNEMECVLHFRYLCKNLRRIRFIFA